MCTLEFPAIETEIWQEIDHEDLLVLGITGRSFGGGETEDTVAAFAAQTGVTFPILREDETYARYAEPQPLLSPYPLDVIVDRDGTIRYLRRELDLEAMRQTLESLLSE